MIRGRSVMLDSDLAALYGVQTRALLQAVKRNATRFPPDFMFQLLARETRALRSQFVISNRRGGRRYAPYAFTEQGVAMLSSVLKSRRAVEVNVAIMRAFVRLRAIVSAHHDLAARIDTLEERYDGRFRVVFDAIRALTGTARIRKRAIGFRAPSVAPRDAMPISTASGSTRGRRS